MGSLAKSANIETLSTPIVSRAHYLFSGSRSAISQISLAQLLIHNFKEAIGRFTAFGMGRRQCPGESLAKMELFLIIANLVQKFQLLPLQGEEEVDMSYACGLILYPKRQHCRVVWRDGS